MVYSELEFLFQIKQNPERFLDNKSLNELIPFLHGYLFSHEIILDIPFDAFGAYVADHYHLPRELGFERAIRANTTTEVEAFDIFFDLLDSFSAQVEIKPNVRTEKEKNKASARLINDNESLIGFLLRYEKRIAMLIDYNSFQRLVCLIKGIQWSEKTGSERRDIQFVEFINFVKTKLNLTTACRYDRGILAYSSSDQDALSSFFQLLHEYIGNH